MHHASGVLMSMRVGRVRSPEYDTTVQYVVLVDITLLAHLSTCVLRLQLRAAADHALLATARVPLRPLIESAPIHLGSSACRHTVDLHDAGGRHMVRLSFTPAITRGPWAPVKLSYELES